MDRDSVELSNAVMPQDRARALRTALSASSLLGFNTATWGYDDTATGAKPAFIGVTRKTPDIFVVRSLTDDPNDPNFNQSLRGILEQSGQVDGDQIYFSPALVQANGGSPVTLTLTQNTPLSISNGITIDGNLGNGNRVTIDGDGVQRATAGVFDVNNNVDDGDSRAATLQNLNITGGNAQGTNQSSPFTENGGDAGGGIHVSSGALNLSNSRFSNNIATGGSGSDAGTINGNVKAAGAGGNAAGAVFAGPGTTVTASNLMFTGNSATAGAGGAADPDDQTNGAGADGTDFTNSNSDNVNAAAVCFTTGTLIGTERGDAAVEDLHVGDLAVTASGAHRPIRWIGSRAVNCRSHAEPRNVMPVRITAGALGENRPARDLVVSPGHAICLDVLGEVLIPASALVNGTTITQQDVDSVTYWHVELDSHDILIAEGQPAESYLEMGNRGFFVESGVVDLDATPDADAAARTHADFCRPYVAEGVVLDAVRAQVQARAERRGWRLDAAPWADMHLMVDGTRIEADTDGLAARFALPASAQDVWLVSGTSAPRDIGLNADPRRLGLCLRALTIGDDVGETRSVALDDPLLCLGFHPCEEGAQRWTAGRSRLPAALFDGCRGTVFLRLDLVRPALPRWAAPPIVVVDETINEAPRLSLVA